jgi:iron complex outermembrane recepter protein
VILAHDRRVAVSVLAIAFGLAAPAMAQTNGGDTPSPETQADIIVTARSASASIIGSRTPLLRYPQSVRVLDEEDLTPLNATRLQDALDYAGGVTRQNDFGGLWDKYAIRGFAGDENTGP